MRNDVKYTNYDYKERKSQRSLSEAQSVKMCVCVCDVTCRLHARLRFSWLIYKSLKDPSNSSPSVRPRRPGAADSLSAALQTPSRGRASLLPSEIKIEEAKFWGWRCPRGRTTALNQGVREEEEEGEEGWLNRHIDKLNQSIKCRCCRGTTDLTFQSIKTVIFVKCFIQLHLNKVNQRCCEHFLLWNQKQNLWVYRVF